MGKWTDKDYITRTEWKEVFGGCKDETVRKLKDQQFRPLPFEHCSLTLQPYTTAVCTRDPGLEVQYIFDHLAILAYLATKKSVNPVTGAPLKAESLLPLVISRDPNGRPWCPITRRPFGPHSRILCNAKTGQVYSQEAVQKACAPGQRDALTDAPFAWSDMLVLQDPLNPKNVALFKHSVESSKVLHIPKPSSAKPQPSPASVTSTASVREAKETLSVRLLRQFEGTSQRARLAIRTSLGDLVIELLVGRAPRASYHLLEVARKGGFVGESFGRIVPGSLAILRSSNGVAIEENDLLTDLLATPDPPTLLHTRRGQFGVVQRQHVGSGFYHYITFAAQPQMDHLHTVIGSVQSNTASMETLDRIESSDQPISIVDAVVLEEPFTAWIAGTAAVKPSVALESTDPVKRARSAQNTVHTIGKYVKKK